VDRLMLLTLFDGPMSFRVASDVVEWATGEPWTLSWGSVLEAAVSRKAKFRLRHDEVVMWPLSHQDIPRRIAEDVRARRVVPLEVLSMWHGKTPLAMLPAVDYLVREGVVSWRTTPPNDSPTLAWVHGALEKILGAHRKSTELL